MNNKINYHDYPITLDAKIIQEILGLGRRQIYELLNNPPFNVLRIGRLIKVNRDVFFEWHTGQKQG